MTNEPNRPSIEVKVSVSVTIPGYGTVSADHAEAAAVGRPPTLDFGQITLLIPALNPTTFQRTARVWTDAGGVAWICAQGAVARPASTVYARVYKSTEPLPLPGSSPPFGDSRLRSTLVNVSSDHPWLFSIASSNALPGADCLALSPGAPNTLVVWVQFYGDSSYTSQYFLFFGVCSGQTDCGPGSDAPGASVALLTAAFPVRTEQAVPAHPSLTGVLRHKTGRFATLPDAVTFTWDADQQGWMWTPAEAHCGTFIFIPFKDAFLLRCSVSDPPLLLPREGGQRKPLHMTFEVTVKGAKSGKRDSFLLEIKE